MTKNTAQKDAPRKKSVVRGHWIVLVKGMLVILTGIAMSLYSATDFSKFPGSFQEAFNNPGLVFSWATALKLVGTAAMLFGAVDLIYKQIWLATSRVTIKREGIEWQTGLINHIIDPISYSRIESVALYRSLLGRMLNYGTLKIYGIGSGSITIPHLKNAKSLAAFINRTKDQHKRKEVGEVARFEGQGSDT
jgi:uncharacterized membrane protein YdbT with pleckstrin-like domain